MTAEELRIVRSDLHTKRRYNLMRQAHITALKQLGKYKIKTI